MKFLAVLALPFAVVTALVPSPSPVADAAAANLALGSPSPASTSDIPTLTSIQDPEATDVPAAKPLVANCINKCLKKHYKDVGCGNSKDWDCICRRDRLAQNIRNCIYNKCETGTFEASLRGVEKVYCGRAPNDPSKPSGPVF